MHSDLTKAYNNEGWHRIDSFKPVTEKLTMLSKEAQVEHIFNPTLQCSIDILKKHLDNFASVVF